MVTSRLKVSEEERGCTKQANFQYLCCHLLHSFHVCYLSYFSTEFYMFVTCFPVPCPYERMYVSPTLITTDSAFVACQIMVLGVLLNRSTFIKLS